MYMAVLVMMKSLIHLVTNSITFIIVFHITNTKRILSKMKLSTILNVDNCIYNLSVNDVKKTIDILKLNKSDGEKRLNSDHIINGHHLLIVLLTNAFNCMLIHGVCPDSMISGINTSSVFGKVFDWVLLLEENNSLNSCDLQFGFKQYVSTTHCTFATTDIISYYNSNRSNVYTMLLDATKAFDRVNYCKLFRKLLDRNTSPLVLRLLLYMYTNQSLQHSGEMGKSF